MTDSDPRDEPDDPFFDELSDSHSGIDLDAEVIRSLLLLSAQYGVQFGDYERPPEKIIAWLEQADRRHVEGLLVCVLRQWHTLRR